MSFTHSLFTYFPSVPKQLETNNADAVGGVIAVIIILILIAVLVVWFRKR